MSAVPHDYSRADGAAVALDAFEAHFDPMVRRGRVVAQQRGRLVLVEDENVEVAVVVEVAKGAASALVMGRDSGAGFFA